MGRVSPANLMLTMCVACVLQADRDMYWTVVGVGFVRVLACVYVWLLVGGTVACSGADFKGGCRVGVSERYGGRWES